jgi:hypothetical protein
MTCYTVFKRTGTHADVLAAIGAADVLRHLEPRIVELADRFEIRLRKRLALSDLGAVDPGFSYLERSRRNAPGLPPERIRHGRHASAEEGSVNSLAAMPENRMYTILGRMKAYGGPNMVVSRFAKMNRNQWTRNVWTSLHGEPSFSLSSPLVQLFNPQSGKGYALLKPSGTNRRDKTKDRWAEPFLEWLRFRGYFEGAAGWFTSGDLRIFCPIPADIPYEDFAAVAAGFRELRLGGTAVKIDCRAVLGIARLLVERIETPCPRQAISGLWATQYKDMGQAHTFMAMEQLAVPDWFPSCTPQHAQRWLETLEEHDTVLRRLTDSHSDEFALLKQYRRTFQTRWEDSTLEFVKFLAEYGALLFQRRARDHWMLPQFRTASVVPILKRDPQLRAILRNPGFLAVAAAIRSSTVGAQAAHYHSRAGHREIRYGLLADIRRADSLGRRDLLGRVSAFINAFNQEGIRRRAAGLRAMQINNAEWGEFAALIEHLSAGAPAGPLLCGFSTCLPGTTDSSKSEPMVIQAASA